MKFLFMIFITMLFTIINLSDSHALKGGLMDSLDISSAGMKVQSKRLSVIAQNIANAESAGVAPGDAPYRRKVINIGSSTRNSSGIELVEVRKIDEDKSAFKLKFNPSHPAANAQGYVWFPNVDKTVEIMDARETNRSYEANLSMSEITKSMAIKTLEVLR